MTWNIFKNLPTANRLNFDSISPTDSLNFAWSVKHRTQWHCLYCASQLSERIKFSLISFNIRLGDRCLVLAIFYYACSFCFLLSVSHHTFVICIVCLLSVFSVVTIVDLCVSVATASKAFSMLNSISWNKINFSCVLPR